MISAIRLPSVLDSLSAPAPTTPTAEWDEGHLHFEEWKSRGRLHRVGGPAVVAYREDGSVQSEWWYRDGKEHRLDGPSYVLVDEDGLRKIAEWKFAGGTYFGQSGIAAALRKLSSGDLLAEIAASSYGPLLDEGVEPDEIVEALEGGVRTPEGIREVSGGAPVEWVRAYEESQV